MLRTVKEIDQLFDNMEFYSNQIDEAIEIMREVAAWGRSRGFRVWPDEENEAVYLHKFCVRREFAGRNITTR